MASPGYQQGPRALQKVTATIVLMYRQLESTLCGGSIPVDWYFLPHGNDYARMLAGFSRTLTAMPFIEALELTLDDCALREHNEYTRMMQPKEDEEGRPLTRPIQLLCEWSGRP